MLLNFHLKISLLFILSIHILSPLIASSDSRLPIEIKIGVVAYDDLKNKADYFSSLAKDLTNSNPTAFHTKFAFGTYEEISNWIVDGSLDVAAIGPGIFVDLERRGIISNKADSNYELIGRETAPQNSIKCFSKNESSLKNFEDIKKLHDAGKFKLIAPNALSSSGFMLPWSYLDKNGVRLLPNQVQFTYSHTNALRFLKSSNSLDQMACIWAGSLNGIDQTGLNSLSLRELESTITPDNLIISRKNYPWKNDFIKALIAFRSKDFTTQSYQESNLRELAEINRKTAELYLGKPTAKVPIDDIILSLTQYITTQPNPPRLALVLSGGGAKCAYQLGAIRALEEKIEAAKNALGLPSLDINLVVGTSGGAVNALPVALGLTKSDAGYKSIKLAWSDMDQRELIRPPLLVRLNLGLWFGVAQLLIYLNIRRLITNQARRRVGVLFVIVGLIEMMLGFWPYKPWNLLGLSSNLHRVWLWLSIGVAFSGIMLTIIGTLTILSKKVRYIVCVSGIFRKILIFLAIALPIFQAWVVLVHEETLTDGSGLEAVLKRNYSKIIRENFADKNIPSTITDYDISQLSHFLVENSQRERDLVLTASPLATLDNQISSDLYFYLPGNNSKTKPNFGERGVSLIERPRDLFSVLLGSAAIYPLFPARPLKNYPATGKEVNLVDGSFAHRSPVEAAVLWGATHIVVIEASPIEPPFASGLAGNLATALNLLYDQAQLTDLRAHGIIPIYKLYPLSPQIGLLDFADNLIQMTIEKGYREAINPSEQGAFNREYGSPIWWDPIKGVSTLSSFPR